MSYEKHTLADYRKLDLGAKIPASLGPDWDEVEKLGEGRRRREEYSKKLRREHEVGLERSNRYPRKGESREMLSKPEMHNEYVKTIPKPPLVSTN